MSPALADHWQLNRDVDFLNHGSFGACPTVVLDEQRRWIERLERDPIEFLAPERGLPGHLQPVRRAVADLVGCAADDLVFVRSATDGVNAVVQSFPFQAGDQVLVTNHGYGACNRAVQLAAETRGVSVVTASVPFPIDGPDQVLQAIEATLTARTRLAVIDHVTSATALIFPIRQIVQLCHDRGVRVLVDGAHAPGMVPLDLPSIAADYYTGNHHKWLCAPKASAFLHVQPQWQSEVRPTVISHAAVAVCGAAAAKRFQAEFGWTGTFDPSPLLAIPRAIEFLKTLVSGGLPGLMEHNRRLASEARGLLLQRLQTPPPAPESMLGSMATLIVPPRLLPPLSDEAGGPSGDPQRHAAETLQRRLVRQHRIEVPVFVLPSFQPGQPLVGLRISAQVYNQRQQYQRLVAKI